MDKLTNDQIDQLYKWFMSLDDRVKWVPKIDIAKLCEMAKSNNN